MIKNLIKNLIRTSITEILKEPGLEVEISEYIVNHTKSNELTVWDVIRSPKCESIKLSIKYTQNKFPGDTQIEGTAETFPSELEKLNLVDFDGVIVETVDMYVRYQHEGEIKLIAERFTKYNKRYDSRALEKIRTQIKDWFDEHPELKL